MELDKISEMVKSKQSYINTVSKVREGGRIRYRYGFLWYRYAQCHDGFGSSCDGRNPMSGIRRGDERVTLRLRKVEKIEKIERNKKSDEMHEPCLACTRSLLRLFALRTCCMNQAPTPTRQRYPCPGGRVRPRDNRD